MNSLISTDRPDHYAHVSSSINSPETYSIQPKHSSVSASSLEEKVNDCTVKNWTPPPQHGSIGRLQQKARFLKKNDSLPTLEAKEEFLSLFEIDQQTIDEHPALQEKRDRISQFLLNWHPKHFSTILIQRTQSPLIQTTIEAIIALCDELDIPRNVDEYNQIYQSISNQINNIKKISSLIARLQTKQPPISQAAISLLCLSELPDSIFKNEISFQEMMCRYIDGNTLLEKRDLYKVYRTLLSHAKQIDKSLPTSPIFFTKMRMEDPISKQAIHLQARLHKRIRESKVLAANQDVLCPLDTTKKPNVFALNDYQNQKIAYYKIKPNAKKHPEVMEELLWDIAVYAGLESMFVPTGIISLKTKKDFSNENSQSEDFHSIEMIWDASMTTFSSIPTRQAIWGSIQPAQKGTPLYLHRKSCMKSQIEPIELIKASIVVAAMGFFDAHGANIIIDPCGKIKFFDNTCALPHSNGCILWGGKKLRPAFRSALLTLKESHLHLSAFHRELIFEEIEKFEMTYLKLVDFFEHPLTQKKMMQLPDNWLYPEDSLQAMKERIKRLKDAMNNPYINTLCELSLASQPNLRFFVVLSFLDRGKGKTIFYLEDMEEIGIESIQTCILTCISLNFDLQAIKTKCDDLTIPFVDLMKHFSMYASKQPSILYNGILDLFEKNVEYEKTLLNELFEDSKDDFKDI